MKFFKMVAVLVVPLVFLALAGCGSDSSSSTTENNPFSASNAGNNTGNTPTAAHAGVIMFTSAAELKPGSQTNMLEPATKEVPVGSGSWSYLPLMPFKVTDSNGNPRVGVPVTLYVYSISTLNPNDVTIDFLVPQYIEGVNVAPNPDATNHNQQTITTDSAGMGIFNVSVTLNAPTSAKSVNTVTVVFKAVTIEPIPVTAYIGMIDSLTTP